MLHNAFGPATKSVILATLAALIAVAPAWAQGVTVKEEKAGMLKKAKVTADAATAAALAKVPGGKVDKAEIEEEKGKLIYSFDIKVAGKSGIDEVAVDAMTGKVLSVEHESPEAEAKEAKSDSAKAAKEKAAKAKAAPTKPKKP